MAQICSNLDWLQTDPNYIYTSCGRYTVYRSMDGARKQFTACDRRRTPKKTAEFDDGHMLIALDTGIISGPLDTLAAAIDACDEDAANEESEQGAL